MLTQENREKIIEAHLIDSDFTSDFYGQEARTGSLTSSLKKSFSI